MSIEPVCVDRTTDLRELVGLLARHEISGMPVVDTAGAVVGVVSATDVVRRLASDLEDGGGGRLLAAMQDAPDEGDLPFEPDEPLLTQDLMTESPVTVRPGESLAAVAALMREHRIHRVIVVDDAGGAAGIVTSLDTLATLAPEPGRA